MNKGKTIFSQIMSLIPERDFKACVDRYKGNYRSRNLSCKDQFLVMSYAQLTGRRVKGPEGQRDRYVDSLINNRKLRFRCTCDPLSERMDSCDSLFKSSRVLGSIVRYDLRERHPSPWWRQCFEGWRWLMHGRALKRSVFLAFLLFPSFFSRVPYILINKRARWT